jgi:hypothetical protein
VRVLYQMNRKTDFAKHVARNAISVGVFGNEMLYFGNEYGGLSDV